jgi:predicted metal-binding membrane protein
MSAAAPFSGRSADGTPPASTLLEAALKHDRLIVLTGLSVVTAISWFWILSMSADMYGSMRGASAWAMAAAWDLPHLLMLFAMWAVMMTAMMLPSAVPMLMLYIGVVRKSDQRRLASHAYSLAGGYLVVWSLFSGVAAIAQRLLTDESIVSPMMDIADIRVAAAVLILVGVYQFTPLKHDCLAACRSPIALFTSYWRPGLSGAFRMGLRHGLYCVGCCWALMLLLFAGGVMNAYVIGGLTLFVLIEKISPIGRTASRIGGGGLAGMGVWLLLRSWPT